MRLTCDNCVHADAFSVTYLDNTVPFAHRDGVLLFSHDPERTTYTSTAQAHGMLVAP